jgi:hypothetical protein
MNRRALLLAGMMLAAAVAPAAQAADGDALVIRQRMMAQFDRPDQPLTVDPIVTGGGYAVAGWTQGDMGGRALLRRDDQGWRIILCSGDGLKDASLIRQAGASAEVAADLARRVAAAEAAIDPARRAYFSRFQGVVEVEAGDHRHGG